MSELSIGAVARATGLPASTLRYYEKAGLLPAPPRKSRQRRYDDRVFARIDIVRLALDAGFTIRETRNFLSGFSRETPPSARWRELAARKLAEIDAQMQRQQRMKRLLEQSFHCNCPRLEDCESWLTERRRRSGAPVGASRRPGRRDGRKTECAS